MTINVDLLRAIANATAANSVVYVSREDGLPLIQHAPSLILVDVNQTDPEDVSKVAARITDAGVALLQSKTGHAQHKPVSAFTVQSGGLVLPKTKRTGGGGSGAPVKYPFDTMQVSDYFFVANSDVSKGDAFKTMSSAVGSANQRYAVETGEMKQVSRAKRGEGNKAIKGHDGKNIMETVTIAEKKMTRKFTIRAVTEGQKLGEITSPVNGVVVYRSE